MGTLAARPRVLILSRNRTGRSAHPAVAGPAVDPNSTTCRVLRFDAEQRLAEFHGVSAIHKHFHHRSSDVRRNLIVDLHGFD